MLQATKPFINEIDAPQPASSPRELVHWALGIVRRQFVVITSTALIVASLGALYAFMAPPTYTADARYSSIRGGFNCSKELRSPKGKWTRHRWKARLSS